MMGRTSPFCSVLNIVVDHIMVSPTPLEPIEFQQANSIITNHRQQAHDTKDGVTDSNNTTSSSSSSSSSNIQVPVIRIFGPILRHNTLSSSSSPRLDVDAPLQSSCLYVHGAFPYLLARPVVAGPDGSLWGMSPMSATAAHYDDDDAPPGIGGGGGGGGGGSVNWDSVESVQRILPMLQLHLETALQQHSFAALHDRDETFPSSSSSSAHHPSKQQQVKIIRHITIVVGRGFYTYCPGPPAPFLRVEYYNPKMRWKVKLILERGIPDLPRSYHPDPQQYMHHPGGDNHDDDATNTHHQQQQAGEDRDDDMLLRFHCYEAHIPYSVQFFKDYNLAGMSYLHLAKEGVKFRHSLPKRVQHRWESTDATPTDFVGHGDHSNHTACYFLESTIDAECMWELPTPKGKSDSVLAATASPPLMKPCTFDGSHSNDNSQQNRHDYLTSLQQSSESSQPPPSQGSPGNRPPSPLIRQPREPALGDTATTILRQQLEDVPDDNKLVDWYWTRKETSCDVELDVSVQHILNVQDVMTSLPDDQRDDIHWRAVPSLREIWRQERYRMSKLVPPEQDFLSNSSSSNNNDNNKPKEQPVFTLNVKRGASIPGAKLAQEGMKRLIDVTSGLHEDYRRVMKDIIGRHLHQIARVDQALLGATTATAVQPRETMDDLTSPLVVSKRKSVHPSFTPPVDDAIDALGALASQFGHEEEEELLQESEDDQSQWMEEYSSSPIMASPFQQLSQRYYSQDSPSGLCAAVLDPFELSQRVERGDCVLDGPFENVEDFIDPETLAPFSNPEDAEAEDDYLDGENDDEMDETELESSLSILATQTLRYDESSGNTAKHLNEMSQPEERVSSYVVAKDSSSSDSDTDESAIRIKVTAMHEGASGVDSKHVSDSCRTNCATPGATQWTWPVGQFNTQTTSSPPCKNDCSLVGGTVRLHPLNLGTGAVPWLPHSKQYHQTRKTLLDGNRNSQNWLQAIQGGFDIEPLQRPPCSEEVASWTGQKLRKRRLHSQNGKVDSERQAKKVNGEKEVALASTLRYDENSRQLTVAPLEGATSLRGELELGTFKEVEEVEWKCSQQIDLTLTQSSQSESLEQPFYGGNKNDLQIAKASDEAANGGCSLNTNSHTPDSDDQGRTIQTGTESESPGSFQPLGGIGNQGGRIQVEGGGGLKAKTRATQPGADSETGITSKSTEQHNFDNPTPLSVLSIEIHVQCRTGRAGVHDSKEIAMTPNSGRDRIFAVVYAYGLDPGGGEALQMKEFGCIFVPVETENLASADSETVNKARRIRSSMPQRIMGVLARIVVESVRDERQLLLRLASIVRRKDPDMLVSWDTQGAGLGYVVERGVAMGKGNNTSGATSDTASVGFHKEIDMARLLSRIPTATTSGHNSTIAKALFHFDASTKSSSEKPVEQLNETKEDQKWSGSGLGGDWDDRVGPGAAAASIAGRLVFAGWKIVSEEVKHANASYLQSMVSTILNKRIPYHDNITLTRWYAADHGRERWRTLNYKLTQAAATILLIDALDIIGRAGEAARLSGVEFSQSFPGIRGSQYKVEGVLLRALQSLHSDERGQKRGSNKTSVPGDLRGIAIDGGSSLSNESKSQTQSPWKIRRKSALGKSTDSHVDNVDEGEESSLHDLVGRNYFFFSPSLTDANKQEALEVQALTLEPQSGHQVDPVVVCDFTALYPSLVIAYNLCYSTCFGKLDYHSTRREMRQQGRTTGKVGPIIYPESRTATILVHHMKSLQKCTNRNDAAPPKDRAYAAPNGTLFVSEAVLKGVLPQVLDEILSTRAMLKKAAKEYQRSVPDLSPSILRQLEARQLALKYVANVTYGYTSATFSGRCAMPTLADTIVECGRRTLTNAINLANQWGRDRNGKWYGCQVIYGDTDSVFVKLPGRSVQEGFAFGEEFCKAVTASNPPPVQLKLEKVYHGSIMQTKKKYCGMKYESKDQRKPTFEAKGIETIRRDQCALTQKILRNSLITLFQERGDLTQVKHYLERQWSLILAGRLPVSDFILTGRVRSRYRGGRVGPVQAVLARRLAEADPGRMVRHKERLPYVIVAMPGRNFRLRDCVLTPMELLEQWDAFTINSAYYITKHVNAALQRCLGLEPHLVNVQSWFDACPKPRRRLHVWPLTRAGSSLMISSYFGSDLCSLCSKRCKSQGNTRATVCAACRAHPVQSANMAWSKWNQTQQAAHQVAKRCHTCNLCFEDASTFAALKPVVSQKKAKVTANDKKSGKLLTTSGAALGSWTAASRSSHPGIVLPLANCTCIDCPATFERHRLCEAELEAEAVCQALDLF